MAALALIQRVQRLQKIQATIAAATAATKSPKTSSSSKLNAFAKKYASDYAGFCKLLDVVGKDGRRVKFRWKAAQRRYHEGRTARDVILKGRQLGTTTEGCARDLWHFLTRKGARVVIVVQSIQGHTGLLDVLAKLEVMLESVERELGCAVEFKKRTESEWQLAGRNATLRIIEAGASRKAASKKGRAGTVTRLHCTEVAFWEHGGETLNALEECVPGVDKGSEIEFESTANGASAEDRGSPKDANGASLFHWKVQDAQKGVDGFRFHFFAWYDDEDCTLPPVEGETFAPRDDRERKLQALGLRPEQLRWYRAKVDSKGQAQTDQEYPSDPDTCFLVTGRTFFDKERTAALIREAEDPVEIDVVTRPGAVGQVRIFRKPDARYTYVIALDPSEGTGGDPSVGVVYVRETGEHVATLYGQFRPWELAAEAVRVARAYRNALIVVERQNHGHTVLRALVAEQRYRNIFVDVDGKPGWNNVEPSRNAALAALEKAHREGVWKPRDRLIMQDVRSFIVNKLGKAEAAPGAHDDLVLAGAIGWDVLCRPIVTNDTSNLPQY